MSQENVKRLEIVGALASVFALIWAMFFRGQSTIVQAVQGASSQPGAASGGYQGMTGAAGAPGAPGTPGVVVTQDSEGAAGFDPSNQSATAAAAIVTSPMDLFHGMFDSEDLAPVSFTSAAPKVPAAAPAPSTGGGCGCGNKGAGCSNRPASQQFLDGAGNCLSSTQGTLARAIDACTPDNLDRQLDNMQSNVRYAGIAPALFDMYSQMGFIPDQNINVRTSTFGAS